MLARLRVFNIRGQASEERRNANQCLANKHFSLSGSSGINRQFHPSFMRPREGFAESGWICFYIAFSHSCDKCWTEINLREEGFVLVQKFGIVHLSREGMGQECEEAGHITSTVRKLRGAEMLVFTHSLSLFCLV